MLEGSVADYISDSELISELGHILDIRNNNESPQTHIANSAFVGIALPDHIA
jgi:hypothetical protein